LQYIVADLVLWMCPEWLLEVSVSKYILMSDCVHLCVCVTVCHVWWWWDLWWYITTYDSPHNVYIWSRYYCQLLYVLKVYYPPYITFHALYSKGTLIAMLAKTQCELVTRKMQSQIRGQDSHTGRVRSNSHHHLMPRISWLYMWIQWMWHLH